ncbi:Zinc/iron permease [Powellomyces hirtus]|nr:Zinc/iron permease [Powellomyces hirtus]
MASLPPVLEHDHDHDHEGHDAHEEAAAAAAEGHSGHAHGGLGDCTLSSLEASYNMQLHVAAIFIIMAVSFAGTILPIIAKKLSNANTFGALPFQALKLFGGGVILSTAIIHMLLHANENLTSECLTDHLFHDYHSWAGAICVAGMLFTHLVQFVGGAVLRNRMLHKAHIKHTHPKNNTTTTSLKSLENGDAQAAVTVTDHDPITTAADPHPVHRSSPAHADDAHVHSLLLTSDKRLSTYMLEAGIASHSILIGLTLGVARGSDFPTLLIAVAFHQFFEGLALSSVVMDADFSKRVMAIGMVVFYTLTTPLGIALGIALKESFSGDAQHTILTIGFLDALAAGILLYDGLVNIIVPHFITDAFRKLSLAKQSLQIAFLWLGALAMAVIGRWA